MFLIFITLNSYQELMVIPLQLKVFIGFTLVLAVACGLTAVLLYERRKIKEIERAAQHMHKICEISNNMHEKIGALAVAGEEAVFGTMPTMQHTGNFGSALIAFLYQ